MANLEQQTEDEDNSKHTKMSKQVSALTQQTPNRLSTAGAGDAGVAVRCLIPSFAEACQLVSAPYSCLVMDTHRRHIALSPMYLNKKRTGIQDELNTELLRFSESLKGVPLAYDNVSILGCLGDIYDDMGYVHMNIEASFVVFQPQIGQKLLGIVNKLGVSHVGCLVHGCFNASVPKPGRVSVETWREAGLVMGTELEFEVEQLDTDNVGVVLIRGRLNRTRVQELMALSENYGSNDTTDQPALEPTQEPKKKKKKRDKHMEEEEEKEEEAAVPPPSLQGGALTPEVNGTAAEDASTNGHEGGEKRKKKKKKDKRQKGEEVEVVEEEKSSPVELRGSDSSGYLSDKPNKKRKKAEYYDDILSCLNLDAETPSAKKKKKKNE